MSCPAYQHAAQAVPTMKLTDTRIRALKPNGLNQKISDGRGLFLLVTPTGSKLWRLAYRLHGLQKLLSLGRYPEISLAVARERREEARRLLQEGIDPSAHKKSEAIAKRLAEGNTFAVVAEELLAKKSRDGKSDVTIEKNRWLLDFAIPYLGQRPVSAISAAEILNVVQRVEKRGRYDTAVRLRALIGQVIRFAIATARAENDPTQALRGALTMPQPKSRAAVTDAAQAGGLLRAIDGFDGQPTTMAALQLMALLFPRPGELRLAQWKEFDLDAGIWAIPSSRMKMRREHRVPLPRQAVAILRGLENLTGDGVGGLVFPGVRVVTRPISENTMNGALRRLGYTQDQMTAHGFRAMASTLLNESNRWSPDAIERALAHQDADEVRRAYARGAFWAERVEMAQWWADYLDNLRRSETAFPPRASV